MHRRRRLLITLAVLCLAFALGSAARAEDWPAYRHDLARSGVSAEQLPTPLHLQWAYVAAHAPRPAWPEPGRELNRLAFDYAYQVAIADGQLYFGSSADHKVTALDLRTGRERWCFFTEGPVRFAPAIADGRVFVASDDGWVYCLSAGEGKLLWRVHGGPRREKLMGNGQMVSRWPVRTGVGVDGGTVYFAAGMWPSEGVTVMALRAEDGEVLWENATSDTQYVKQPHPGSFSMTGVAPQGYILGREGQLFVPTGRSVPAAYDRDTGELLYYRSQPDSWGDRWGGSWCMLAEGLLFNWRCHVGPDIDVRLGEYPPDKKDGMIAFDARTGKVRRDFPGKLCAVARGGTLYATGSGKVTAYDLKAWAGGAKAEACTRWETDHGRAYELILAGDTLVVGGQGTVTALDASKGEVLWQDKVGGQARGLAVADGRLLVSTTEGHIRCYGPEAVQDPPTLSPKAQRRPLGDDEEDAEAAAMARRILDETGKKAGYCLALGAGDGRLLVHLAKQSELIITCVEPDARQAASVRELLDAAGLYGVRVAVHHGPLRDLAAPPYFADLVVLGDGTSRRIKACSAEEIYRVLRPCGGCVYLAAAPRAGSVIGGVARWVRSLVSPGRYSADAVAAWLKRGGVPEEEVHVSESAVRVVRGTLPESDDWTHQYASAARTGASEDQRVRLPLKLLWFGRPGPARLITRHWGGPAPLCVNGRMFVLGQKSLMAVDAYNGRPLWRRDFPKVGWWHVRDKGSSAAADEDSVYLIQDDACLRLDAATGETRQTFQLPPPPPEIPAQAAKSLRWSTLAVGHGRVLGSMGSDREARAVFVLDKDGTVRWTYAANGRVNNNSLSMDERRVYLIDRTSAAAIAQAKRRGKTIPAEWTLLALDADTGKVAWQMTEGIAGRTELWLAEGVLVASSRNGITGYEAASGKRLYERTVRVGRFPVITRGTVYIEPYAFDLRTGEPRQRPHPLTGEPAPWDFRRSYGCGSIAGGPNLLLFRSGTLGMCDLAGDSGVHNFGGVRAGCYVNAIVANGLVLCPPADAACTCSYSFRTTVALAPAEEDRGWSVFFDRLPTASLRQAAFNLGAPGDRRDQAGTLWLALPRPETRSHRSDIAVPYRFTVDEGFGPVRHSPDRIAVRGTDRPWVYASGIKGLRRVELDLAILDRGFSAWPAGRPPGVDGRLDDPCWDGYRAFPVAGENASVTLRYDAQNLYLAYERPGPGPWKAATQGQDAEVWRDHSFEVTLSPVPPGRESSRKCIRLGVAASGARYDASWAYVSPFPVREIPRVEDVAVDAKPDDWGDGGLKVLSLTAPKGKMKAPEDFDPTFRIGWSDAGLLLLAQVKDDQVLESSHASRLWEGDSVEFFLTPQVGSGKGYQVAVSPGADPKHPKPRLAFYGPRGPIGGSALTAEAKGAKTPDGYLVELLLPWKNLGLEPADQREFGMQLFANDNDKPGGSKQPFRVLWHPRGHPFQRKDPLAYQAFRLGEEAGPPVEFRRGPKPDRAGLFTAVPPLPFPFHVPPLGARGEDAAWSAAWSSAVQADGSGFRAELAIPWKTLEEAGLDRRNVMVDLSRRGPLSRPPRLGAGTERLLVVPEELDRPRTLALRLHFAELEDVRRGERVFDIKLQGQTVLEDFDLVRVARGTHRAVVVRCEGATISRALTIEFVPKAGELSPATAPILCGIELEEVRGVPPAQDRAP